MRKLIALAVLAMLAASPAKACYLNTCEANADNPWRQAPPQPGLADAAADADTSLSRARIGL